MSAGSGGDSRREKARAQHGRIFGHYLYIRDALDTLAAFSFAPAAVTYGRRFVGPRGFDAIVKSWQPARRGALFGATLYDRLGARLTVNQNKRRSCVIVDAASGYLSSVERSPFRAEGCEASPSAMFASWWTYRVAIGPFHPKKLRPSRRSVNTALQRERVAAERRLASPTSIRWTSPTSNSPQGTRFTPCAIVRNATVGKRSQLANDQ